MGLERSAHMWISTSLETPYAKHWPGRANLLIKPSLAVVADPQVSLMPVFFNKKTKKTTAFLPTPTQADPRCFAVQAERTLAWGVRARKVPLKEGKNKTLEMNKSRSGNPFHSPTPKPTCWLLKWCQWCPDCQIWSRYRRWCLHFFLICVLISICCHFILLCLALVCKSNRHIAMILVPVSCHLALSYF